MNVYLTTTVLNETNGVVSTGVDRKHAHLWKKKLLDLCIDSIERNEHLSIAGLIAPRRLVSQDSYRGYSIQKVDTTINQEHPDYEKSKKLHNQLCNRGEFDYLIKGNEVLHIQNLRFGLTGKNYPWSDNEHQIIFEKMLVDYPCIIIDGDVIIHKCFLELCSNKSKLIDTGRIYLVSDSDKNKILINRSTYITQQPFIDSYHFTDPIMHGLLRRGYKFDNIINDLKNAGFNKVKGE